MANNVGIRIIGDSKIIGAIGLICYRLIGYKK